MPTGVEAETLDLVTAIGKRLASISELSDVLTDDWLRNLYHKNTKLFSKRVFGAQELTPTHPKTWERMLRIENKLDELERRIAATKRIAFVALELDHRLKFDAFPTDDRSCIEWLSKALITLDLCVDQLRVERATARARARAVKADTDVVSTVRENEISRAINRVFGFGNHDIQNSRLPRKKYFGYRRSANSGAIVRFFIEIEDDPNSGLIRFNNYFRRFPDRWIVNGCGFAIGNVTYLLGNAKSSPNEEQGKGVRLFTLQPYELKWITGLLDTRDNQGQPIAAKVVLIPADQHECGKRLSFDPKDKRFISYISKGVNPARLSREIKISSEDEHILNGMSVADLIQSLIWNGSLRTLHGAPQPIPGKRDHEGLRRLIEVQQRVLKLDDQPPNDVYLFMRLLSNKQVYEAVDTFLARLEKLPKRPLATFSVTSFAPYGTKDSMSDGPDDIG